MYHPFSILETIKSAWHIFKTNFVTIIVYSIISFILLAVLTVLIEYIVSPEEFAAQMLVWFILIFIQAYTTLGLYKLIFTVIDSEYYEFEFRQVLPGIKMLFSYIAVVFLLAFMITNCTIVIDRLDNYPTLQLFSKIILVIAALYFLLRIMFFNTFIVDDKSGPIESMVQSFKLTKGYFFRVLVILFIILLFIAVPALISEFFPIASVIIIVTYPFVNIILAVTYRKLVYSHLDVDDDITETV